jgi:hypothetical protein
VGRQSSHSFDEHERPTAPRAQVEKNAAPDPNSTQRLPPFELDQVVQKGSGTRPVVTAEQIDRYMKERTVEIEGRATEPAPPAKTRAVEVDIRERQTVDALTVQRETLVIKPPADAPSPPPQIPIDVDLSRLRLPSVRPAAGRPVPFATRLFAHLDQRQLTIAIGFLIAMVSALLGFIAGRM